MELERCDRCGDLGHDRRTLWMACLYDMDELGLPFKQDTLTLEKPTDDGAGYTNTCKTFFTLRVCKEFRASWMEAIQAWFHNQLEEDYSKAMTQEADTPVRINGSVRFLTEEQYYA